MGGNDDVERVLEQLAGPLDWLDHDRAVGHAFGRPIAMEKLYRARGNQKRVLAGVTFVRDLVGRPIHLQVSLRESRGPGPVDLRERAFTDVFDVQGWPEEAVDAALDDETRQLIADGFDGAYPTITTKHGQLRWSRRILHRSPARVAEPAELAPFLAAVQTMGANLVDAFDAELERIRRTQGDEAATAWYDEQTQRAAGRARRRGCTMFLLTLFGLAVGGAFAFALVVGWL